MGGDVQTGWRRRWLRTGRLRTGLWDGTGRDGDGARTQRNLDTDATKHGHGRNETRTQAQRDTDTHGTRGTDAHAGLPRRYTAAPAPPPDPPAPAAYPSRSGGGVHWCTCIPPTGCSTTSPPCTAPAPAPGFAGPPSSRAAARSISRSIGGASASPGPSLSRFRISFA